MAYPKAKPSKSKKQQFVRFYKTNDVAWVAEAGKYGLFPSMRIDCKFSLILGLSRFPDFYFHVIQIR